MDGNMSHWYVSNFNLSIVKFLTTGLMYYFCHLWLSLKPKEKAKKENEEWKMSMNISI